MQSTVFKSDSRAVRKRKLRVGKQNRNTKYSSAAIFPEMRNIIIRYTKAAKWSIRMTFVLCLFLSIFLHLSRNPPLTNETQVSEEYFPKNYTSAFNQKQEDESVPSFSDLFLRKYAKNASFTRTMETGLIEGILNITNITGQRQWMLWDPELHGGESDISYEHSSCNISCKLRNMINQYPQATKWAGMTTSILFVLNFIIFHAMMLRSFLRYFSPEMPERRNIIIRYIQAVVRSVTVTFFLCLPFLMTKSDISYEHSSCNISCKLRNMINQYLHAMKWAGMTTSILFFLDLIIVHAHRNPPR